MSAIDRYETRALKLIRMVHQCEGYALARKCNFRMMLVNLGGGAKPTWCVNLQHQNLTGLSQTFHHLDLLVALEQLVAAIENEPSVPLKPTE